MNSFMDGYITVIIDTDTCMMTVASLGRENTSMPFDPSTSDMQLGLARAVGTLAYESRGVHVYIVGIAELALMMALITA
jgi:hypothetical protein